MRIKNPIGITGIGDPYVLKHEDRYYLYATSGFAGFHVWVSRDLVNWREPSVAYEKNARSFGYKDFWAPEVIYHDGHFIMHYSARSIKTDSLKIGVAVSKDPLGPFIDVYDRKPMFDYGWAAIDGHVFVDDDGKRYFYFDKDCSENVVAGVHESHIYVSEMNETFTALTGRTKCVLRPTQPWEKGTGDWRWNEGPFMLKHGSRYYLMYSAGFYASSSYSIGYAVADDPFGPFVKAEENPILKTIPGKVSGPGHNSVVTGPDGYLYCVYHVHTDQKNPGADRQVFIDRLHFEDGRLIIEGPTL